MAAPRVLVIGAGMGGLAAAADDRHLHGGAGDGGDESLVPDGARTWAGFLDQGTYQGFGGGGYFRLHRLHGFRLGQDFSGIGA